MTGLDELQNYIMGTMEEQIEKNIVAMNSNAAANRELAQAIHQLPCRARGIADELSNPTAIRRVRTHGDLVAADVQRLQSALNEHEESLKVDGPLADDRARGAGFPGRHGLTTDGIVGPQTWGALTSEAIDAGLFPTDYPAAATCATSWRHRCNGLNTSQEGAIRASVPVAAVVWGSGSRESQLGAVPESQGSRGHRDHGHGAGLCRLMTDGTRHLPVATNGKTRQRTSRMAAGVAGQRGCSGGTGPDDGLRAAMGRLQLQSGERANGDEKRGLAWTLHHGTELSTILRRPVVSTATGRQIMSTYRGFQSSEAGQRQNDGGGVWRSWRYSSVAAWRCSTTTQRPIPTTAL